MNSIIFAAVISWFITQFVKVVFGLIKYGLRDRSRMIWRIIWAGGMPSAHSAVITAMTVTILQASGLESPVFGLSVVMSLIVIYDRSRAYSIYSSFQKKYPEFAREVQGDPLLNDLVGHRFSEIIVGVIIGAGVGMIMAKL
ncbi:divergent PAP2 family protein [Thermodesulfobacteriota bacterium]